MKFGKLIGKGAFGKVYLGTYNFTRVAIKQLEEVLGNTESKMMVGDLQTEIKLMMKLKHPNLITFYGVNFEDNHVNIIMEYCSGGSLYEFMTKKNFVLSYNQKLKILYDLAASIYHLHKQNPPILHRDIKSSNLLLKDEVKSPESEISVKLSDFGFARIMENEASRMNMSTVGTPVWTAPEVLKGEKYGIECDIYSFGIVMWEVFSSKIPYLDKKLNVNQIILQVCTNELRPTLSELPNDMPKDAISLMKQCWNDNPRNRPNVGEIIEIISKLMSIY